MGDPLWLRGQGLFVAEGRLVVSRLVALGRFEVCSILVNAAAYAAMRDVLEPAAADVYLCADGLLRRVTGFNFHRGCLALARRPAPTPEERLHGAATLLALEGVGNPDNVGGLFRTGAAFGVDGLLLNGSSGDPFYRKAIRTSMGATLRLPFARAADWPAALAAMQRAGFVLLALTPHADASPLAEVARALLPAARLLIAVGSEGDGLASDTLRRADVRVRIPIRDDVDSLNVTVAAGAALERLGPLSRGR